MTLTDGTAGWTIRQDLLASGPDDRDFVVEIDNDAVAHLRFGDGTLGRRPDLASQFTAIYRVGCGVAGNVGYEAITHLVLRDIKLDGVSITIRNPLPAQGGVDPESIAEAKLFAPHDFHDPAKIERAITASERLHRGEIRFALEGALHVHAFRLSTRQRARQVFAELGVWDTEENSGVLVYVQLVDRRIEIVADRGIAARVPQHDWDAICRAMERAFKARKYREGALAAIDAVTQILAREFPARGANPNELPDKPAVL